MPIARNCGRRVADRYCAVEALAALLVVVASVISFAAFTGVSHARTGAPPVSMTAALAPVRDVDQVAMPAIDVERLLREDEEAAVLGHGGPARFAAPIPVDLGPDSDGTWEYLPNGGRVWRLRVLSPGALSLNFGFGNFHLPPGATVHLYPSPEGLSAAERAGWYSGPHTARDADTEGGFWTAVIPGDETVIEMHIPANAQFEPGLRIIQVAHDYRGFGRFARDISKDQGDCNIDVICPQGDPWRDEIRSVAVYSRGGTMTCTGTLINSHDPERPPYFLTAHHCGVTPANARTMVVYWNYESPGCGALCCGSMNHYQTGATLVSRDNQTDFCLVRLSQEPDSVFNVYYSGWDAREETSPGEAVGIHHPQVREKAISFTYTPLSVTSYLLNSVPGDSTHWRVHFWDAGTTEPGSSGSGLWNSDRRLVGQLHGGYASCTSLTSDWYGRLSRSWEGGGTPATRLHDWLDPQGTGGRVIDGLGDPGSGDAMAGDANLDGVVNVQDVVALANHILEITLLSDQGLRNGDLDRDGEITVLDLVLVVNMILADAPPLAGLQNRGRESRGGLQGDLHVSTDGQCGDSGSSPVHVSLATASECGRPGLVIAGTDDLAAIQVHLHSDPGSRQHACDAKDRATAPIEGLEGSGWSGQAALDPAGSLTLVLYNLSRPPGPVPWLVQIPFDLRTEQLSWNGAKAASTGGVELAVAPSGFPYDTRDTDMNDAGSLSPTILGIGPNPFRDDLSIRLLLPSPGWVEIRMFDVRGRLLRVHSAGSLPAGTSRVDLRECQAALREPGIYFLRVAHNGRTIDTRSVVLVR